MYLQCQLKAIGLCSWVVFNHTLVAVTCALESVSRTCLVMSLKESRTFTVGRLNMLLLCSYFGICLNVCVNTLT